MAQDSGWWNPKNGAFEFCYAYDPEGRTTFAARRREWRVLDLVAPSLKLHPNAEISPLANPFMPYDMNPLFKINGGWGWRGERTIARWYTMYATITQSRDWLPNEIGGVVWLALDNVATSIYVLLYCGITDVPKSYKTCGRVTGFSHESAWWAFNRLGTLAAQRWGDMRTEQLTEDFGRINSVSCFHAVSCSHSVRLKKLRAGLLPFKKFSPLSKTRSRNLH